MHDTESMGLSLPRKAWDFDPALTEDRLRLYARLRTSARRDTVALAACEMVDDRWSVGCRAYAFGKQRLKRGCRVSCSSSWHWHGHAASLASNSDWSRMMAMRGLRHAMLYRARSAGRRRRWNG
jgi:hypothetical protein